MYINDVRMGERVMIIDDVLSTGGTLRPILLALKRAGAQIAEVLVAVEKGSAGEKLEREFGVPVRALVKVEVRNGRLVVVDRIT
jgi:adenine phosphoribosyltransferase